MTQQGVIASVDPGSASPPVLETVELRKWFRVGDSLAFSRSRRSRMLHAVDDISLKLYPGEVLGIVGESGCGKSTLARTMLRLCEPDSGQVLLDGADFTSLRAGELRRSRRSLQMIFQDPFSSLNPRQTVGEVIREAVRFHRVRTRNEETEYVTELLERVGLKPGDADKRPREFSGGQRQRIGIARALSVEPRVLLADEPVSSLDVSIQARILDLLSGLRTEMGLSMVFITHDLAVVRYVSDRVAVMYLGQIVERGDRNSLFTRPHHPYTKALLASAPRLDRRISETQPAVEGDPPSPIDPPRTCRFVNRCREAMDICFVEPPPLREVDDKSGPLLALPPPGLNHQDTPSEGV